MISFLCPTRGRPTQALRFLKSIQKTQSGDNEVLFGLQLDDPKIDEYSNLIHERAHYFKPTSTVTYWNELAKHAKGDLLTLAGDDIVIQTPGWDKKFKAVHKRFPDDIYVITTQDGRGEGYPPKDLPAPHPTMTRKWYETLGYLTFPKLFHYHADTWNVRIAQHLGRLVNLYDVTWAHLKEQDKTRLTLRNDKRSQKDKKVFQKNENLLLFDMRLLEQKMSK